MSRNPFYVYALKDPRTKPLKPFYIGKGTGNRMMGHILQNDETIKSNLINEIRKAGLEVIHTVIADDLTEEQALKIEAELISAFGIRSQGGLLVNSVRPNASNVRSKFSINVPDGCYERAQMGLNFISSAVLELAKANPEGIKNSDAAKYLGLQSDYGGGSKDYLSYSILGLLMREQKIKRQNGRHLATTK